MRILFIDCDTLRPDHLGCYGYERNTSGNIDCIAKDGVRFNDYYCSDAPCLPSRAALMTGRFGIHTGVVGHGGTAADMHIDGEQRGMQDSLRWFSLPAILKRRGLYTTSISSFPERHGAWWFTAGFDEWHNIGMGGMETADAVTPKAVKWLEDNKDKENWFLHVHFWDAHAPYRTPLNAGNPFEDSPLPENYSWINDDVIKEHRKNKVGPHSAWELNMFDDNTQPWLPRQLGQIQNTHDFKKNLDGYDTGIWYLDQNIGKIIDWLKKHDMYEDTAIILTSDHGEDLGENGEYSEHGAADYPTTHIPMIIKWPGAEKNKSVSGFRYNVDLIPTLMELVPDEAPNPITPEMFNVKKPEFDGISFAENLMTGCDGGRNYLVLSQCAHICQRSVRFGDYIYIRTYHDGYHLHEDEMLFNIKEDPFQLNNLAEKEKEICWKASYLYQEWYIENMKKMVYSNTIDPLWTVIQEGGPYHTRGQLKKYCERLEKTGRGYAVPEMKKRHPNEF